MFKGILMILVIILVCSCSSTGNDTEQLQNATWSLVSVSSLQTLPAGQTYTINFRENGKFSAVIDCNNVSGNYTVSRRDKMSLSPEVTTFAECHSSSLYHSMVNWITSVTAFKASQESLVLIIDSPEDIQLTFQKSE